jgi:hypothetical protein
MKSRTGRQVSGAVFVVIAIAVSGCGGAQQAGPPVGDRGPGMKPDLALSVQLPVRRSLDLAHVEPQHFAAALGNDPVRIFEFIRDAVAFEAYPGLLRGPRGTLLALAGNSVDRAALLGAMLSAAGQQVRFARGTLSEKDARDLVTSMWAERSRAAPAAPGAGSDDVAAAVTTLQTKTKRDTLLIRDQLKKANLPKPDAGPSVVTLVQETRPHFWVQVRRDGRWTDFDPSFADAIPGRSHAKSEATFDTLPDALHHRLTVRVRVEEYTGDAIGTRPVLTSSARTADLSGRDLILAHMPENWKGPVTDLQSGIASAIEDTGRVKPVIVSLEDVTIGEIIQQRIKTGGIGSLGPLLSGKGTREPVALVTAEWMEFEFVAPDSGRRTVVREVLDLVGKARRNASRSLSAGEVRVRTEARSSLDLTQAIFSIFVTTGRVAAQHLPGHESEPAPAGELDAREVLRRLHVAFLAASDTLTARLARQRQGAVIFYPDSPRVQIADISTVDSRHRVTLDLRRHTVRAATLTARPDDVFLARVVRGVANGTLERVLGEYATAEAQQHGELRLLLNTSTLFDRVETERIPPVVLPAESGRLDAGIPEDTRARLREETDGGHIVVAPQRAVALDGAPRLAWWRVDPRTGDTTAATDEGLHQVTVGYTLQKNESTGRIHITTRVYVNGVARLGTEQSASFAAKSRLLGRIVQRIMQFEQQGNWFPLP